MVVTTYNQDSYVPATIRSVLAQTFRDYELIVVDDGSTDGTVAQLRTFGNRLRLVQQPNQGVAASRNTGIRHARGTFVAFLDGDDIWEPEKLERQVRAAEANPGSGLVAVDGVQFSGDEVVYGSLYPPEVRAQFVGDAPLSLACYEPFLRRNLVSTTSQVLVPRSVLDAIGPADQSFPIANDWDLYIRIAAAYPVTFLPDKLMRWRYLATSASGPELIRPLRWAKDHVAILKKHERLAPAKYRPQVRALRVQKLRDTADATYWYGRQVDAGWARRHLWTLVREHPLVPAPLAFLLALYLPRSIAHQTGRVARAFRRLTSRRRVEGPLPR